MLRSLSRPSWSPRGLLTEERQAPESGEPGEQPPTHDGFSRTGADEGGGVVADETLVLVGARYSRVEYAVADLELVKALHDRLPVPADLEAAVITRTRDGQIDVVRTYEPLRGDGARRGLGLGLAAG